MRITWIFILMLIALALKGKEFSMPKKDSLDIVPAKKNSVLFYDSLALKASRHKFTKWMYDRIITTVKKSDSTDLTSYEYYKTFENKTINSITIKSLDVFGPDFADTSKITEIWIEQLANKLHSKSNLYVIQKNLWIKKGQPLDPNLVMDNERLLRSLPYLKDVRIFMKPQPFNDELVDILILTKDVFSFGLSGNLGDIKSGEFEIYDKNILGIGHEIGTKFIAHTDKTPHLGIEAYYAINNLKGNFINFSAGYANNFIRKGFFVSFDRDFLRPQSVYAGGLTVLRNFRSDRIKSDDKVTVDFPLNYFYLDSWYGRRLKLGINPTDSRFQVTLAGRIRYASFNDRPPPDLHNKQYFSNSTFYLGSLSFSRRSYVRDYLVYSYGITEDIPKGYLHEFVLGYDRNEFGDRWYTHAYLSSGNLFNKKPFYFFTSVGFSAFWKPDGPEQGMADFKINFISPLFKMWNTQSRQFIKLNYTLGINRFDIEELLLKNQDGIRGFGSKIGKGKQRITLNVENVFFQKRSVLNFQTAFFSFFDVGIVGPSKQSVFKQNYYGGVGLGLRIRNESLIFKTLQIRLAYYPNHPIDVSPVGFILEEVSKIRFYSFQPRGPEPLRFE